MGQSGIFYKKASNKTLIAICFFAIALFAADMKFGLSQKLGAYRLLRPVYYVASLPKNTYHKITDFFQNKNLLLAENEALKEQNLALLAQLKVAGNLEQENEHLFKLLGVVPGRARKYTLAEVLDIQSEPYKQKIVLGTESDHKIDTGATVIDENGLIGQIISNDSKLNTAILISSLEHTTPVKVERTNERFVARGTGEINHLELINVPLTADIKVGDKILTSGLSGRYPEGLPVGTISKMQKSNNNQFAKIDVATNANLKKISRLVLVK